MNACILCDTADNVEKRFILPRHRDSEEGASAKPLCQRCHDQFHWRPSKVHRTDSGQAVGYGYRTVNGRVIPIPDQVETIARIVELRHQGESWTSIADTLNEEYRPTARGGYWHTQTVINIYQRECPETAKPSEVSTPGWVKGRYGWTVRNGELVKHDREQSVIRWMTEIREQGLSYERIAETLNRHKIPSKRGSIWYASSVSHVLRREGV